MCGGYARHKTTHRCLRRCLPHRPTPFITSAALDIDGVRRVLDCMIDPDTGSGRGLNRIVDASKTGIRLACFEFD